MMLFFIVGVVLFFACIWIVLKAFSNPNKEVRVKTIDQKTGQERIEIRQEIGSSTSKKAAVFTLWVFVGLPIIVLVLAILVLAVSNSGATKSYATKSKNITVAEEKPDRFANFDIAHSCWVDLGVQPKFGSSEQVLKLKSQVRRKDCVTMGFKFKTVGRTNYLVYESKLKTLTRFKVEGTSKRYEQWESVSSSNLTSLDASYGFQNLDGMTTGYGSPQLGDEAASLVLHETVETRKAEKKINYVDSIEVTKTEKGSSAVGSIDQVFMTSTDISYIQTRLSELGYSLGKADGISGRLTRDAIIAFQKDYKVNLSESGTPNIDLLTYLQQL